MQRLLHPPTGDASHAGAGIVTSDAFEVEPAEAEVDGHPVRWRTVGTGDPLVLVHGLAGSWRWWSPLFPALAPRRRVHILDLPRRHAVIRPAELSAWISRWLDAADLDVVDLAGHSLGGLVAAELAATSPSERDASCSWLPPGSPAAAASPHARSACWVRSTTFARPYPWSRQTQRARGRSRSRAGSGSSRGAATCATSSRPSARRRF